MIFTSIVESDRFKLRWGKRLKESGGGEIREEGMEGGLMIGSLGLWVKEVKG
jgi:hypothetical protein